MFFLIVDAETFEPEEPLKKAAVVVAVMDKWEGEDEEEDVKVCLHHVIVLTCIFKFRYICIVFLAGRSRESRRR